MDSELKIIVMAIAATVLLGVIVVGFGIARAVYE
jgi:hypothetical protein